MTTKRSDFLYAVQTVFLADCIRTSTNDDAGNSELTHTSPAFILGRMNEIFYAADRIPADRTAAEAAHEFCRYMLDNMREQEKAATGRDAVPASWFMRQD